MTGVQTCALPISSSHYAAKMSPAANSTVIYNGVRGGQAAVPSRTIGVLGRIAPEKGQSIFVDAARIVARSRPDVRFSIAGTGDAYFDRVRSQARDLPVEFPGWVDPYEFLRTLAVLVVPSQMHDTNPRVIPEAFSCRVPVVAFAAGGIPELIRDGETGHLAWERSAEALAQAILRGLDSQCTESAYREWDARFRLERFQRGLCDFFSSNLSAVSK